MYCPYYYDLFLHDDFYIVVVTAFVCLSNFADFAYSVFNQLTRISGGLLWQCVQVLGMGVDVHCYSFDAKSVGMLGVIRPKRSVPARGLSAGNA